MKLYQSPNLDECVDSYCEACRNGRLPNSLVRSCATCDLTKLGDDMWSSITMAMLLCGECEFSSDVIPGITDDISDFCEHRDCPLSRVILMRDWETGYSDWEVEHSEWEAENSPEEELKLLHWG